MRSKRAVLVLVVVALFAALPATAAVTNKLLTVPVRQFSLVDWRLQRASTASTGYRSPKLKAPKAFNLVALSWRGPARAKFKMRVHLEGGWSGWSVIGAYPDHAPDLNTGEGGGSIRYSDPAWAGRQADTVQYTTKSAVRDVKLHFVNSLGTATAKDRLLTSVKSGLDKGAAVISGLFGESTPSASPTKPKIVSREQWGASKCTPRTPASTGEVRLAFVHHTVSLNDYTAEEAPAIVLAICRYHRNDRGWNDIGYNFLVDKYGQVFEGREGGVENAVVGAQAQGYNSLSTGVANIGTFDVTGQEGAGLQALSKLLAWKLSLHAVGAKGKVTVVSGGGPENRYPAGKSVTLDKISGHRDGDNTDCPGDALYDQLPLIRNLTAERLNPPATAGYKLTITAKPRKPARGKRATLKGRLTRSDGGANVSGKKVIVQVLINGRWKWMATATTGIGGRWSVGFTATRSRRYRSLFFPKDGSALVKSSEIKIVL